MKLKADSVSSFIGIAGAMLFLQQAYIPELLPKEVVTPIVATLLSSYGIITNKEEIVIPFTEDQKKKKRICELEAELEALKKELSESYRLRYPEPEKVEKERDNYE